MDLANMYVTIMPIILGGVGNMFFTKTQLYKNNSKPMDGGKLLADGRPIFGKNKTWIGFAGMTIITCIMQVIWGMLCHLLSIESMNQIYDYNENTIAFNFCIGSSLGLAYVVCELPNSFVKRRLNIRSGKTEKSFIGVIFFFVDQFDSIIGGAIIIGIVSQLSIPEIMKYIALGGITHILVNILLFILKVRKNI